MKKFSCNRATAFFDYNILIYKYLCLHDFCTIPFDLSKTYFMAFCAWFYISYENRARIVQCTIY